MHYILLAVIGLVMLAVSLWRGNRHVKVGLFVLTAAAFNIADVVAVIFLHCYEYRPGLLVNQLHDRYLGALLAEFLFASSVLAVVLGGISSRRRWLGAPLCAVLFALVEVWLVHTGEFVHLHWRTWMTLVLFTLFGLLASHVITRLERVGYKAGLRLLLSTATAITVRVFWMMITAAIGRYWGIRFHLLPDPEQDLVLGFWALQGLPFLAVVQGALRVRWLGSFWGLVTVAAVFAVWFMSLGVWGLWSIGGVGSQLVQAGALALMIVPVLLLDRWFGGPGEVDRD